MIEANSNSSEENTWDVYKSQPEYFENELQCAQATEAANDSVRRPFFSLATSWLGIVSGFRNRMRKIHIIKINVT